MDGLGTQAGMGTQAGGLSFDPISWWDLDDLSGADQVSTRDFTTVNGGSIAAGGGPSGQDVVSMTGPSYMSQSLNPITIGLQTAYSVSVWVNFDSLNFGNFGNWFWSWLSTFNDSNKIGYLAFIGQNEDALNARGPRDTPDVYAPSINTTTSTWYHVVSVWTVGGLEFYVNGALQGSVSHSTSMITTTETYALGVASWDLGNNSLWFVGKLGMHGLWDKPLTQTDVSYLYNGGNGRQLADL